MKQSNKVITAAAGIAAAAGLAIAGASLASAESTPQAAPSGTYGGVQGETGWPPGGMRGDGQAQDPSKATHPGETLLTGTVADKVTAAAKAKEPGATIERVETDAEGVYEAHMVRADGTHIIVQVDKDFAVTAVQTGGPGGGRGGGPGGPGGQMGEQGPMGQQGQGGSSGATGEGASSTT
jgi:hypothetical protein